MAKAGASLSWGGFDKVVGKAAATFGDQKKALMASIGEALVSSTLKRFDAEEGPDGKKWQPSHRAAAESGKTLTNTAHLRKSIDYAATPGKVMVGSNLPYARIHQLGGTIKPKKKYLKFKGKDGKDVFVKEVKMPARPYLGVSKADMDEVKAVLAEFLAGTFKA